MRYSDGPTADASVHIAAPPDAVWAIVVDLNIPARFSTEFRGAEWLTPGPQAGATFVGHNHHPARGEWQSTSTVTECVPPTRFAWAVGDPAVPSATWSFTLEAEDGGTRLVQHARMGPGPSGLTPAIEAMPDKEGRIVAGRLKEWQQNMDATVSGIKGIAERMLPRLPDARRDDLDDRGRELWDAITGSRGASVTSATGALVGPFNVWLYAPEAGIRLSDLGAVLRFGTSLDRRLLELAIITVGAHWQAEFEWYAHARMAREHGVDEAVIDRIGRGEDPQLGRDDEAAVYAVARQLLTTAKLDEATYIAGEALIGRRGMVELVSLCGYYTMVSFTLNAFRVPLPPGANPQWTG